jgi:hypothetical protein
MDKETLRCALADTFEPMALVGENVTIIAAPQTKRNVFPFPEIKSTSDDSTGFVNHHNIHHFDESSRLHFLSSNGAVYPYAAKRWLSSGAGCYARTRVFDRQTTIHEAKERCSGRLHTSQ